MVGDGVEDEPHLVLSEIVELPSLDTSLGTVAFSIFLPSVESAALCWVEAISEGLSSVMSPSAPVDEL